MYLDVMLTVEINVCTVSVISVISVISPPKRVFHVPRLGVLYALARLEKLGHPTRKPRTASDGTFAAPLLKRCTSKIFQDRSRRLSIDLPIFW